MQTWINFFNFFFWLSFFSFFFNSSNFLSLLFYSEVVWLILYCYSVLTSCLNDDILLFCTTFFLLALASLEFCFGLLLVILFKNLNKSLSLNDNNKTNQQSIFNNKNKLYFFKIKFNKIK